MHTKIFILSVLCLCWCVNCFAKKTNGNQSINLKTSCRLFLTFLRACTRTVSPKPVACHQFWSLSSFCHFRAVPLDLLPVCVQCISHRVSHVPVVCRLHPSWVPVCWRHSPWFVLQPQINNA